MDTSLIIEFHIFLSAIYGGLIGGLFYDIYRTIRYYSKPSRLISYLGDLIFWIIITSIFFYILIKINWGEIRGYIIFGFLMGVLIYAKIFSRFIYPIFIKIGRVSNNVIKGIISIILYPFRALKKNPHQH